MDVEEDSTKQHRMRSLEDRRSNNTSPLLLPII